jgi:putative heme-binding domain-containing protein
MRIVPSMPPLTSPRSRSGLPAGIVAAVLVAAGLPAVGSPPVAPTEALSPAEERAKFRLPPGFEIQLVASEPEIQKPMNMAFDARGRLWVTHSVEYPFAAKDGTAPRDGLTVLEGFGPDGRASKATLFADGLNIPIGVLPLPTGNEAIVWSIPNIWKLTDTDGDGRADRREVLYGPFDFVDTHGDQNAFRLGPDGWVYACHGFRNASKVRLRGEGNVVLEMTSGHTYRFRPDGSAIELVTAGQVNPFGMCFDSLGNQFNADCHSKPLTMLLRGGCYDSFGKPHDGLGYAPALTGDDHGSTGIAGAVIYEADQFPRDYHGSAFVGNVITNVVHRDRLEWRGSSPWIEKPENFVACDDWWFRPVDLQLGPDGGLYIADFYNCIIGHYEVDLKHPRRDRHRGRIWRVVWKGDAATPAGPFNDLAAKGIAELLPLLADANQTVRRLASEQLVERCRTDADGVAAIRRTALAVPASTAAPAVAPAADGSALARSLAVRVLGRLDRLDDETVVRLAGDPAPVVRVHLVKAIAGADGWNAARADLARTLLADPDVFVRRAAAEAIAAHPGIESIPPLLRGWADASAADVQLIHAIRIAVRNQLRATDPAAVAALTLPDDDWLRLLDVAVTIPREPEAWLAFGLLRDRPVPVALASRCFASVAQHCGEERLEEATRFALDRYGSGDLAAQASLYQTILDGWTRRGRPLSDAATLARWGADLAEGVLAVAADPEAPAAGGSAANLGPIGAPAGRMPASALSLALNVAAQLRLVPLAGTAIRLLTDARQPSELRSTAAATALALDRGPALASLAAAMRDGTQPQSLRVALARRLADDNTREARQALAAALPTAQAPLQQPIALGLAKSADGAELLLSLVAAGKASGRLLQDKTVLDGLAAAKVPDLDRRVAELTRDLPPADAQLVSLIARVTAEHAKRPPDVEAGAAIFQRACANCHRFGGTGGAIGPQLDGVGQRGTQRLLEDILDPNRNVDEAFRTTTVATADGRAVSGLKLRDEGADVVLADAAGREVRIHAAEIEEQSVSRLSPMPSNMADQIGERNLPDLLAYLMQAR